MNFLQLAQNRYSVRKFQTTPIEQEKIDSILKAAQISPTAVNYQPQRIIVVNEQQQLDKIKECTPFHFSSPLAFIVCYDNTKSWRRSFDDKDFGYIDASIVTTHMMLQITDAGLGTTFVGHFEPEKLATLFQLPDNIIPVAILPTGYLAKDAEPAHLHEKRLDLEKTVCYNTYNFS